MTPRVTRPSSSQTGNCSHRLVPPLWLSFAVTLTTSSPPPRSLHRVSLYSLPPARTSVHSLTIPAYDRGPYTAVSSFHHPPPARCRFSPRSRINMSLYCATPSAYNKHNKHIAVRHLPEACPRSAPYQSVGSTPRPPPHFETPSAS